MNDPERASDAELATLAPLMVEIAEQINPLDAMALRMALANGATVRVMTIRDVDVDVVRLARWLARRGGAMAVDVTPGGGYGEP